MEKYNNCPFCDGDSFNHSFTVTRVDKFAFLNKKKLPPAKYFECFNCSMMLLDDTSNYETIYSDGAYYTLDGDGDASCFLSSRFKTVINLPKESSDNIQRVKRIHSFISNNQKQGTRLLDIGAGTGVFMYEYFQQFKVKGMVLEPDPYAFKHLNTIFTDTDIQVSGDLIQDLKTATKFNLITLNRVLEHISEPGNILDSLKELLDDNGYIYLEVPDVHSYYKDGKNNEAFGYGHYHVYSPKGLINLIYSVGLDLIHLNRCVEPSGKFTLYAFIQKRSSNF
jgi:SAM-dependent methyltransferase